ncbi:MAG: LPXTG cell wall anchor domain-containing protein [Gaiellales bacterium]|nr:MAG: LPXTG cell wall anchor domain-containing protein [Gaiellales bacterium]
METGSELVRIAVVGGLLVAGGIVLAVLGRRRNR